jgi:hypothetical protein
MIKCNIALKGFLLVVVMVCGCTHREQDPIEPYDPFDTLGNGALLLPRYNSIESLAQAVTFHYSGSGKQDKKATSANTKVTLTHRVGSKMVTSILSKGVSENDFVKARDGNAWDKIGLAFKTPFAAWNRNDLRRIEALGRKRPWIFGKGDIAFFDLAENMVHHIHPMDTLRMSARDLSEKGYLNTFNHVMAQSFMTSIFSESIADFVADIHERARMPELITGEFSEKQLLDIDNGPVDNYIDIINNEWGQELGKVLRQKYSITRKTRWTPILLANYLNDVQAYHSWACQIGFAPFYPTDDIVIRFAVKINTVMSSVPKWKQYT